MTGGCPASPGQGFWPGPPPRRVVLTGDARAVLAGLPAASVDCVVTSPPYFGLRDYGIEGQLGMEPDVMAWADGLRTVMAEVARVLKPHGALWLNVADSFSTHPRYGAPVKSLLLGPERLLLGLAADGWLVRNRVVWAKPNPMPSPVLDRLILTWEVMYLLVRRADYYFDLDAIREPHQRPARLSGPPGASSLWTPPTAGSAGSAGPLGAAGRAPGPARPEWAGLLTSGRDRLVGPGRLRVPGHRLGKNPGDLWRIASHGISGHHATFPPDLVRRPILATCPPLVCQACGRPAGTPRVDVPTGSGSRRPRRPPGPRCDHPAGPMPGVVLDPFFGTGTVGLVAQQRGRDWLGTELNPGYAGLAAHRLHPADGDRGNGEAPSRDRACGP